MMGRSMLAYIPVNLANIIASFGTIVVLTRLLNGEEFVSKPVQNVRMM